MKLEKFIPRDVFTAKENILRQGLEISHMLTVSISHISQETAEDMMLDEVANRFKVPVYTKNAPNDNGQGYGLYVYLDEQCLKNGDFGEDLARIIELALDNGCNVLCLDSDGPEIPGIPVYEWED